VEALRGLAQGRCDRLVHHCHIVNIRGNSYRMRHHAELRQALNPEPDDETRALKRSSRRREVLTT
jgi:hypothetical protein